MVCQATMITCIPLPKPCLGIVQIGHLSYGRCKTTKCTQAIRLQYEAKKNAVLPLRGPGLTATWHRIANRPTRAARGREPHLSQKRITPAPANASNMLSCQKNRHNGIADHVPFWKAWTDLSHSALVQNVSHKIRCQYCAPREKLIG